MKLTIVVGHNSVSQGAVRQDTGKASSSGVGGLPGADNNGS